MSMTMSVVCMCPSSLESHLCRFHDEHDSYCSGSFGIGQQIRVKHLRYADMAPSTSLEQTASVTVELQVKRGEVRVGSLRRSRRKCIVVRNHDDSGYTHRLPMVLTENRCHGQQR